MWFENQVFAQIVKTNKRHQSFSWASSELECIVNVTAMDFSLVSWIMWGEWKWSPGQESVDFRLPGHFRRPLSALLNMPGVPGPSSISESLSTELVSVSAFMRWSPLRIPLFLPPVLAILTKLSQHIGW